MNKILLTTYLTLGSLLFAQAQTKVGLISDMIDMGGNGIIIQNDRFTKYNYNLEEEWSVNANDFTYSRRENYVSNSEEMIYSVGNSSLVYYKKEAEYLYIIGCNMEGELLSEEKVFDESKWIEIAEFVGENNMNFIFVSEKQKVKNGEPFNAKWVRFDNEMNRTEQNFQLPSHGDKGSVTWEFLFEDQGSANIICNFTNKKESASTILVNIQKDGVVKEKNLSSSLNIHSKSQEIQAKNSDGVKFQYLKETERIYYQFINEDYNSATIGSLSKTGEKLWESTEKFEKKVSLSIAYKTTRCSFAVLNGDILVYYMANLPSDYGQVSLLDEESGESLKSSTFTFPNSYSVPSITYLSCMLNPNGIAKNKVLDAQNSVKKEKELKQFTMGYFSSNRYELLWVCDGVNSKIYRSEL